MLYFEILPIPLQNLGANIQRVLALTNLIKKIIFYSGIPPTGRFLLLLPHKCLRTVSAIITHKK